MGRLEVGSRCEVYYLIIGGSQFAIRNLGFAVSGWWLVVLGGFFFETGNWELGIGVLATGFLGEREEERKINS